MSDHKAEIVGTVKHAGVHGITFAVRCCDDDGTLHGVTIEHAGELTADELDLLIQHHLETTEKRHDAVQQVIRHVHHRHAVQHAEHNGSSDPDCPLCLKRKV